MQLEDLIDRWYMLMRKGKPVKPATMRIRPRFIGERAVVRWGERATRVDQADFLAWKLTVQLNELLEAQATAEETCAAFVSFGKRLTQVQAAGALHYHNEAYWTTGPASGPQEIIWDNVAIRG